MTPRASPLDIAAATPADVPLILAMVRELADYERAPEQVVATEALLGEALFGARPTAEAVVARVAGEAVGFALFFHNFSTWLGRRGLYLEDLYVRPPARGRGVGRALLVHLATIARQRGCGRFEWSVLDWNEPAIRFYRALGAAAMDEWTVFRLDRDGIERLAALIEAEPGGGPLAHDAGSAASSPASTAPPKEQGR
jgi:GNAT superfamily N-acetyltransferase